MEREKDRGKEKEKEVICENNKREIGEISKFMRGSKRKYLKFVK